MKEILWILLLIVIFLIFLPSPNYIQREPSALFTKDGCTIYRWYDKGQRMYYTKCDDGTSPTISR